MVDRLSAFPIPMSPRGESGAARRFGSVMLVLLLHLLILLALLHMVAEPQRRLDVSSREIFLRMVAPVRPAPSTAPAPPLPVLVKPSRGEVLPITPPLVAPVAPPDWRGLGRSLFGCAPEALANMPPEERSHCSGAPTAPDDTVVMNPTSHVQDPERRAAEMRAKNTPANIPCTYIAADKSQGLAVPGVSLVCLAGGLFGKGFAPLKGLAK